MLVHLLPAADADCNPSWDCAVGSCGYTVPPLLQVGVCSHVRGTRCARCAFPIPAQGCAGAALGLRTVELLKQRNVQRSKALLLLLPFLAANAPAAAARWAQSTSAQPQHRFGSPVPGW